MQPMWFENRFSVNGSGRMRLTALERHSAAAKIDSRHVAAWMSRLAASAQSQKQPKTLKVALAIDPRRDRRLREIKIPKHERGREKKTRTESVRAA
jgi:hypothetical protein